MLVCVRACTCTYIYSISRLCALFSHFFVYGMHELIERLCVSLSSPPSKEFLVGLSTCFPLSALLETKEPGAGELCELDAHRRARESKKRARKR